MTQPVALRDVRFLLRVTYEIESTSLSPRSGLMKVSVVLLYRSPESHLSGPPSDCTSDPLSRRSWYSGRGKVSNPTVDEDHGGSNQNG